MSSRISSPQQLATCLRSVGRRQEAIAEFEEARKHMEKERNKVGGDQYWASVHINLGYMYAEGGGSGPGMVKAAEIFRKVMQPCPLLPIITHLSGRLARRAT